ncbi:sugar transferase [Devosia geojensis]|uniref:Sugar transferase n=1 Tax=Devosia geojensis TaxID=443610 RepID=A0A0F5FT88_9HYPH|nr:sugar transferase [Devosia geojensis]KKB11800.1 sugar transferase [Devosia geojensis]
MSHIEQISVAKTTSVLSESPRDRFSVSLLVAKRGIDILSACFLGLFFLPLIIALVLIVRADGGSAFYCQRRLGRDGREFRIWKLRSMVVDADRCLELHLADPAAREEWDRTQKLRKDPRVTPVGRLMRKYSLDELPQLWNVLNGDMSLVGPRPMLPEQRALYPGNACFRLRPGITGLWQVSDRHISSFAERARYDEQYVNELSLQLDMMILLRTISVVFRGTGC